MLHAPDYSTVQSDDLDDDVSTIPDDEYEDMMGVLEEHLEAVEVRVNFLPNYVCRLLNKKILEGRTCSRNYIFEAY